MNFDEMQFDLWRDPAGRDEAAWTVRVSARARRLSVRVYPDARVEVVTPPRVKPKQIEQFVAAHREWIDNKCAQALRNPRVVEPFPPASVAFALTNERWRVHLAGGTKAVRVRQQLAGSPEAVLRIEGNAAPAATRHALRAWVMKAARERLEPLLVRTATRVGVSFKKLSVRRQRSRWGSCSARGTISLNACLLFQRQEVVEYLIVHELMHVRHMNHSPKFWAAVQSHCPGWRLLDRELLDGWRHVPRWMFHES